MRPRRGRIWSASALKSVKSSNRRKSALRWPRRWALARPIQRRTRRAALRGAVYVSCSGRGGPHFGGPSAELQIIRRALGDVPLVGFFAGGEIARSHVYGYTGVLTVFTAT